MIQPNEKIKTTIEKEAETLIDIAKEASKLSSDIETVEALEDAKEALELLDETMELTGKMLNILEH